MLFNCEIDIFMFVQLLMNRYNEIIFFTSVIAIDSASSVKAQLLSVSYTIIVI